MKTSLSIVLSIALLLVFAATSCSTLSKQQLSMIESLSLGADTITRSPRFWVEEMAALRRERGLYYLASLSGSESQFAESNALYQAGVADLKFAGKINAYVEVMNAYTRSLRQLGNTSRWSQAGVEIRGLGRQADSILLRYNQLDWGDPVLIGAGKQAGKIAAYMTQQYLKGRQMKHLKEIVAQGDTLVATCTGALAALLKSEDAKSLVINEKDGLNNNYRAYLANCELRAIPFDREAGRQYWLLCDRTANADRLRSQCAAALSRFASAHHKLRLAIEKRPDCEFPYAEILELNNLARSLAQIEFNE